MKQFEPISLTDHVALRVTTGVEANNGNGGSRIQELRDGVPFISYDAFYDPHKHDGSGEDEGRGSATPTIVAEGDDAVEPSLRRLREEIRGDVARKVSPEDAEQISDVTLDCAISLAKQQAGTVIARKVERRTAT